MLTGGTTYILANGYKRLYTGVTSDLMRRVAQHKRKLHPEYFTARYNITQLVYYEHFERITEAIHRESQIKNMHRQQKIAMIVALNPTWQDLSAAWGKPTPPFDPTKLRNPETF